MPQVLYLTIKDFVTTGLNFRTGIKTWDFAYPRSESFSWSHQTKAVQPLIITRKKDQHSGKFASLSLLGATGDGVKFSEASLTVDETGHAGGLLKRTIYDFAGLEVSRYSSQNTFEVIYFNFARASVFETSIERIIAT